MATSCLSIVRIFIDQMIIPFLNIYTNMYIEIYIPKIASIDSISKSHTFDFLSFLFFCSNKMDSIGNIIKIDKINIYSNEQIHTARKSHKLTSFGK